MAYPSRILDYPLVLSKLKETAYGTVLTDANIQGGKRWAPNSPFFADVVPTFLNDAHRAMRGTHWPATQRQVEANLAETFAADGDPWLLGWLAYFGLGKITTTNPGSGTAYLHTCKPLDPATDGHDLPSTSIYRERTGATGAKAKLHGCIVSAFELSFPASGLVQLSAQIVGSGQQTTGAIASLPALQAMANVLHSNDMVFKRGTQANPADITGKVVRGSVRISFTWNVDAEHARTPGSGLYRNRAWVTQPAVTVEWQEFADNAADAEIAARDAGTVEEVLINVPGAVIEGTEKYAVTARLLASRTKVAGISEVNGKTVLQMHSGPEDNFKESINDVFTLAVENTETSYGA